MLQNLFQEFIDITIAFIFWFYLHYIFIFLVNQGLSYIFYGYGVWASQKLVGISCAWNSAEHNEIY